MNKTTHRPSVHEPRRESVLQLLFSGKAGQMGGSSVRAWLIKWAGAMAIAVGWAFAIAAALIPKTASFQVAIVECGIIAACFFGFGVGWHVCEGIEEGEQDD